MSEIIPIRSDCVVRDDAVAELLTFVASEITMFSKDDGDEPRAIAIYIRGERTAGAAVMSFLTGIGLDEICDLAVARLKERATTMREEGD